MMRWLNRQATNVMLVVGLYKFAIVFYAVFLALGAGVVLTLAPKGNCLSWANFVQLCKGR